jgi:hypothetical protein
VRAIDLLIYSVAIYSVALTRKVSKLLFLLLLRGKFVGREAKSVQKHEKENP